jgi:hypothetical protein
VRAIFTTLIGLAAAAPLAAQTSWATISGLVADKTDAAIPNVQVRITPHESKDAVEVRTDSHGGFSVSFLTPGNYRVRAFVAGFKTTVEDNIKLHAGETFQIKLRLEVGEMSDRVTVSGGTDSLDTTDANRSDTLEERRVQSLPMIGRTAYNLLSIMPGVVNTQEQFGTGVYTGLHNWDENGKFVINGGLPGTNQFLLNGAPISLTGTWQLSPSVDAVQELKVLTNNYDAQFGRTGGGTVNVTLRSGGNAWHGSLFEYFHNPLFDYNGIPIPSNQSTHQFGGIVGGPVRKDKDFLFLSFEGYHEITPIPVVSDTPPLDLRDGQHFSTYGIRIYDPNTTHKCHPGIDTPPDVPCFSVYVRNPFPGDVIPQSRISEIGRNILALYPMPNGPNLTQNYLSTTYSGRAAYVEPIARWDHNFSDRDRFYALFTLQSGSDVENTNGFPAPADVGSANTDRTGQNYIVEWTHILSPSAVADTRLSFGRFTSYSPDSTCTDCLTAAALGMTQMPQAPTTMTGAAPHINLDQYTSIIGNTYTWNTENQFDFAPSLTLLRGGHVLHAGFELVYAGLGQGGPGRANGEFSFTRQWTQEYASRSRGVLDGSGVADLLLGAPYSGFIDYNDSFYRTWPYYAAYLQDTWKLRSNLTVNLGLRYDVQIPFVERENRTNAGFDFTAVNPLSDAVLAQWKMLQQQFNAQSPEFPYPSPPAALYGGQLFASSKNRRPFQTDWTDLQPRVGVAWTFAPKTVLRAGAGIFYRTAADLNYTNGFSQSTSFLNSLDGGLTPSAGLTGPYSLQNPFPNGILSPKGAASGLLTDVGNSITYENPSRPVPRTYEYSVGFQREFPFQLLFEGSYSGSLTVHDAFPVQLDALSMQQFLLGQADPNYLKQQVSNPFYGILPAASGLGGTATLTNADLLTPYPLFQGVTQTNYSWARYRYDSLQLRLEKRVLDSATKGVMAFLFSYSFSKSFEASHFLNAWDLSEKPIHELSAADRPQSIAFAGTWDLPIGWGRRWLSNGNRFAGALTNGWAIDWIWTYYSGTPVDKPDAIFTCASYFAPGGQTADHWFNNDPSCYQSRPLYTLRTTEDRFSDIRTPTAPQLNASVEKTFWLNDRWTLQLRGEAYDVTNTPIYPGPDTNFRDKNFGKLPVEQINLPRYIQVAAKLVF